MKIDALYIDFAKSFRLNLNKQVDVQGHGLRGIEAALFNWIYYFLHLSLFSACRPSGSVLGPSRCVGYLLIDCLTSHVQFMIFADGN